LIDLQTRHEIESILWNNEVYVQTIAQDRFSSHFAVDFIVTSIAALYDEAYKRGIWISRDQFRRDIEGDDFNGYRRNPALREAVELVQQNIRRPATRR
jgi:hypothetical protein